MNQEYPTAPELPRYPVPEPRSHGRKRRYLEFLRSYWWIPLLTVTAAVCGMAFYLRAQPPTFASYAYLWVSGRMKVNTPQGSAYMEELQYFYGTQIQLLRSDHLQQRALNRLAASRPELAPSRVRLNVNQEPRSAVFTLSAVGTDPLYPQAYLNALIDAYLDYKKEVRGNVSDETMANISAQMLEREKEWKATQAKVDAYRSTNDIPVLQTQSTTASGNLANLRTELDKVKSELQLYDPDEGQTNVTAESVLPNPLTDLSGGTFSVASGSSPEVLAARRQIQEVKAKRADLEFLQPKHPKIQQLDREIVRLEEIIGYYRQQTREQLAANKKYLGQRLRGLQERFLRSEAELKQVTEVLFDYERLRARANEAHETYSRMFSMLESVDTSKKLEQDTISVMQPASIAVPAKPDFPRQLGIAGLLGLLVGLGIILLVERMDDRFASMNELLDHFDEEILGQVPETARNKTTRSIDLIQTEDARHIFAESYRNIRSSLLFMAVEGERPKVLLVTSGVPNEGKSTVAANLARTIAFAGSRVLLIDGDLRRGSQHQFYGCARDPGLTGYFRQTIELDGVIRATELPNLFLIPSGQPVENAGEYFLSGRFETLLREVRARFDYVIIDSPPVFAADDATTLGPKVDGVLFILRGSFTRARLARQALDLLYQRQAKVLGMVFNRANTTSRSYYYYKYAEYYQRKDRKGRKATAG